MPNNRFKEQANTHNAVATYADVTADLGAETTIADAISTAFYDMENYDAMVGVGVVSNVVATHINTFQMYEATDTDGSGSQTIAGASVAYTSSQVTDRWACAIEVDADQLTDGYDFVGLRITTDDANGTEVATVLVIPSSGRYPQATPVA